MKERTELNTHQTSRALVRVVATFIAVSPEEGRGNTNIMHHFIQFFLQLDLYLIL